MNPAKKVQTLFLAAVMGAAALLVSSGTQAQGIDSTVKKIGNKTATTAKKIGNKTASTAVKGASKVVDKTYKGKEGPGGQTVYIDKNDRKYYVNGKGQKVYLKESEIRDKKEQ